MIAIIDYHAGNLTSVTLAFQSIGEKAVATADPTVITAASHIVFPGVGAAGTAMAHLRQTPLADLLRNRIAAGTPFLGICLGTQILFEHSEEDGGVDAIGILPGTVKRFHPSNPREKIPHMGWNQAHIVRPHPLLSNIPDNSDFYFVHSYYPAPVCESDVICTTNYADITFVSMVGRKNVAATQFHPEKSGAIGLRILKNFSAWDGSLPT